MTASLSSAEAKHLRVAALILLFCGAAGIAAALALTPGAGRSVTPEGWAETLRTYESGEVELTAPRIVRVLRSYDDAAVAQAALIRSQLGIVLLFGTLMLGGSGWQLAILWRLHRRSQAP